ncbi:hypothetical protein HDV00_004491 [Rhizophlyctis rosea]|nr:hypothetical protein HDV00_004491 [Rhizophlyctis rosea]
MLSDHILDSDIASSEPVRLWQLPSDKYATTEPTAERRLGWATAPYNPLSQGLPPRTSKGYWWRVGMVDLVKELTKCAGWAVVANNVDTVPYIITEGFLLDGADAVLEPGGRSACHDNAAFLVRLSPADTVMMTGYALSDDGMWRGHSWCVRLNANGTMTTVETTCPRLAYFGHVVRRETTGPLHPDVFPGAYTKADVM